MPRARPDKKVLIIAYVFPPIGGSGVQRTVKFVKYLPQFGWQPIVVCGNDPYVIRALLELISIEDAQLYFNAAHIVVLPFVNILTSASVITTLSFGKPLIAPALSCIPEMVNEETSIVYDPADPHGLRQALQCCLTLDLKALGQRAYEQVQQFTWEALAEKTLEAYERCDGR